MSTSRDIFYSYPQELNYLGLSVDRARRLAVEDGYAEVRILNTDRPNERLTMDYRVNRLNLMVSAGVVIRAASF
jgi:hypothetical protein